jgi:dTDP-4-dehydrorhamnose reductase
MTKQRIVILGASGMLGNALTRYFSQEPDCLVTGTVRSQKSIDPFPKNLQENIVWGIDAIDFETVREFIKAQRPNIVINCVGLVKQLSDANDPLLALPINSLFPHMLARCCAEYSARLVHMSTDCVFNGSKGGYLDDDIPDAQDLYGISKRLGEVDYTNAITLRTSIIGHELDGSDGSQSF